MTGRLPLSLLVRAVLAGWCGVLVLAMPAGATWSVIAADDRTGDVGVAFASCVPADVLGRLDQPLVPIVLVPGVAAAMAQGQFNTSAPGRISELVAAGADAADIVADLTNEEFDEVAVLRQYGVVRLPDSVAGFTGAETGPEALDRQADLLAVQGNILTSAAVVDDAAQSFERMRADGASLPDALVEALAAGSAAGGDRRCGTQTALFAQLVVATPEDTPAEPAILLTVTVAEGDGQNPVELLAAAHRRGEHGVIEAGVATDGTGSLFPAAALGTAVVMVIVGGIALARGMGSIRARR